MPAGQECKLVDEHERREWLCGSSWSRCSHGVLSSPRKNGLGWRGHLWTFTPSGPSGTSLQLEDIQSSDGISKLSQNMFLIVCLFLKGRNETGCFSLQRRYRGVHSKSLTAYLCPRKIQWSGANFKQNSSFALNPRALCICHYFYTSLSHATFHEHPAPWERWQSRVLCRHGRCGGTRGLQALGVWAAIHLL